MFIKNQHILLLFFIICITAFKSLSQCADNGNYWSESWKSCVPTQNPNSIRGVNHWILYEFDNPESIDSTFIWNANKPGQSNFGVNEVVVDYSIDDINWIELGQFQFPKANEQNNYTGFYGLNFQGILIKKILFTVLSSHNTGAEDCVSLAEVRFNINKDACYAPIDACGVCDGSGPKVWYKDADGDGLGDVNNAVTDCNQPNGYVSNLLDNCDNDLLGWPEVSLIFEENGCIGCHGAATSGGLDLRSYETAIQGGDKCGPSILNQTNLVSIITVDGFNACSSSIELPSMNTRTGGNLDSLELADLQHWIDIGYPKNCYCLNGATDTDNDGFCDVIDDCPNFDNTLIGQPCNDGNTCTNNDIWLENCNCVGEPTIDSDNDGVCDNSDAAPFNACTADGTIDGIEPSNWVQLPANDCDNDLINVSNGDVNDYDACFNNFGQSLSSNCICNGNVQVAGGQYISSNDVASPKAAGGLPDGNFTSTIWSTKNISLSYPNLAIGEEICFTVGFSDTEGAVNFDVNFDSFSFLNKNGTTNFSPQQFCFNTLQSGFHNIIVSNVGRGYVKLDGSSYTYCSCSENDPEYNTPSCNCKNSKITQGALLSYTTDFNNIPNANSFPDGILTGNFENTDTIIWDGADLAFNSEVCVSLGYNNLNGVAVLEVGNESFSLDNCIEDIYFQPQQFCFFVKDSSAQTIQLVYTGDGIMRVDGAYYTYCPNCELSAEYSVNNQMTENTADGSIQLNITGGLPPFSIQWNTGATTNFLTDLYPGSYLVEISDAAGCSIFETFEIEPVYCAGFDIAVNTTAESSYFSNDGTALCLITGGQAPFSYNWSVNQTDSLVTNLSKGLFSLNVIDVNGCSRNTNFEIETLTCPEQYVQTDTAELFTGIYKVNNFIQTNGFVPLNENVLLKAPNYIQLNNNFEVIQGSDLEIIIDDCQ